MIAFDIIVVIKFYRKQQLAEKNPRAIFARDEVSVLADPAQARARRPDLIHHRRRIHANLAFDIWHALSDPIEQRLEFIAQDIVIIIAPGVTRDFASYR